MRGALLAESSAFRVNRMPSPVVTGTEVRSYEANEPTTQQEEGMMTARHMRGIAVCAGLVAGVIGLAGCKSGGTAGTAGSSVAPTSTTSASSVPTTPSSSATPTSTGGPTSSGTTPVAAGSTDCGNAQIAVSVGRFGAATGHLGGALVFHNTSGSTCVLRGYPGVAGLDQSGQQVTQATRSLSGYIGGVMNGQIPTVELAPGGWASAVVESLSFDPRTTGACAHEFTQLLVTPPNTTHGTAVSLPKLHLTSCSLLIHPVVPGTSGGNGS
jgi:hypothetical protein